MVVGGVDTILLYGCGCVGCVRGCRQLNLASNPLAITLPDNVASITSLGYADRVVVVLCGVCDVMSYRTLTCRCSSYIDVVDGFVRQIVDTERDGVSDVFIGDILGQLDGHADVSCVSVGCCWPAVCLRH